MRNPLPTLTLEVHGQDCVFAHLPGYVCDNGPAVVKCVAGQS